MKFLGTLIAVADMERSKVFYKKHLGLDIEVDFGVNVTLTGGISLQTLESWSGFIGGLDVNLKGNNGELYFEADDFDDFIKTLEGLELVHPLLEHRWGQRVVRFYDPDGHIIEVGENLTAVARRFSNSGMTTAEIAVRMDVQEEYVHEWLDNKIDSFNIDELSEAHRSLLSTLHKCEKVLEIEKLPQSQRTLTERRVDALRIALTLIEREQTHVG
jgi:catechol 2,3-dioxygenase-like lactoylglutathione lyase family enzyme